MNFSALVANRPEFQGVPTVPLYPLLYFRTLSPGLAPSGPFLSPSRRGDGLSVEFPHDGCAVGYSEASVHLLI